MQTTKAPSSSLSPVLSVETPSSFFTARGSPFNAADTSNITSTSTSTSPFKDGDELGPPLYRDARLLPEELKQHCQIQLEEHLYASVFQLYDSVLYGGGVAKAGFSKSISGSSKSAGVITAPAFVAPPSHLALLYSLAIHPLFTSRPNEPEDKQIAAQALRYLRGLLRTVGPVRADLRAAMEFRGRVVRGSRRDRDPDSSNASDDEQFLDNAAFQERVRGRFANKQSIWRRASNFWDVVGWAFSCAATCQHRWRYWKVWLEFVVDTLEADWEERLRLDEEEHAKTQGENGGEEEEEHKGRRGCDYRLLRGSLIAAYIDSLRDERKNTLKDIMRALFAFTDSGEADRVFYREVFARETAPPVSPSARDAKRKRAQMSGLVDDGPLDSWADNDGDDDSGGEGGEAQAADPSTPPRPKRRGRRPAHENSAPPFRMTEELAETIPLRLRLFALVSAKCHYLSGDSDNRISIDKLYVEFAGAVRAKPLALFRLLVDSHATPLRSDMYVTLARAVARALLPDHADPADFDPDTDATGGLSAEILCGCYLPVAVKKVFAEDNAKLSILLENMLWFLESREGPVPYTQNLRDAVEHGIRAREDRVRRRRSGPGGVVDAQEKAAQEALERSARGLRMLLDEIEQGS